MKSFLMTISQLLFAVLMYCIGAVFFGLALVPVIALLFKVWSLTLHITLPARFIFLGISLGAGFFIFGLSLVIIAGLARLLSGLRLKEGNYPIFSWGAVKWAFVSSLYLIVNFTFMDFVLLTPFSNLLLRLLGAKLGRNVQINSKFIFDATLLEIGDNTIVGGSAVISVM
jgi:hypothetical protein